MKLEVETKFNVGDVVRHIAQVPPCPATRLAFYTAPGISGRTLGEQRMIVDEIATSTCSAGTQVYYYARAVWADGTAGRERVRMSEHELVASQPFTEADLPFGSKERPR